MERFMWWSPSQVTQPWKPRIWLGCDEWHNEAISIVVPFLGAFHWFYTFKSRLTEPHLFARDETGWIGRDVLDCKICQEMKEDVD